ncbi:MAG: hypothetical protein AAFR18_22910 [Cyanobacteria bacterium J06627_32]
MMICKWMTQQPLSWPFVCRDSLKACPSALALSYSAVHQIAAHLHLSTSASPLHPDSIYIPIQFNKRTAELSRALGGLQQTQTQLIQTENQIPPSDKVLVTVIPRRETSLLTFHVGEVLTCGDSPCSASRGRAPDGVAL